MVTWSELEMETALRRLAGGDLAACRMVVARARAFPALANAEALRTIGQATDLVVARAAAREIVALLWPNADPQGVAPGVVIKPGSLYACRRSADAAAVAGRLRGLLA